MCSSLKDDDEGMAAETRGSQAMSFWGNLAAGLGDS